MPPRPSVFLITGTPGSGKSSVARALMRRFRFGLHIPVDDLREWVVSGIVHPVPEWTAETGRQFALARAAAGSLARHYAAAGFAVAIDDVVVPAEAAAAFEDGNEGLLRHKVLLRPRLEVALARNAERGTKAFDASVLVATIRGLHGEMDPRRYGNAGWVVVDTSELAVEATVDAILALTLRRAGQGQGQGQGQV